MIEFLEFERLVRDALGNLFDTAALETHPLNTYFPKPASFPEQRAQYLHQVLVKAITTLQPTGKETQVGSVEWRSFRVLKGRYIEGLNLALLQQQLCLSERQLRREHSRAISALATILWDIAGLSAKNQVVPTEVQLSLPTQADPAFPISLEKLKLEEVLSGVQSVLRSRLDTEGIDLGVNIPVGLPEVFSDRVILRQILLNLLGTAIHQTTSGTIQVAATPRGNLVILHVQFWSNEAEDWSQYLPGHYLAPLGYWIDQINASLSCAVTPQAAGNRVDFTLELPQKDQPVLLVADDHAAAIQLIQRYLQDSEYKIVGVQDPDQILLQARRLHPSAVLLDVMMPSTDGWEILQTLKADPTTANTPVLIYSVWHEPELAFSLGAAGYLKKPFNQQDLVQALAQLHPADSAGGADPAAV